MPALSEKPIPVGTYESVNVDGMVVSFRWYSDAERIVVECGDMAEATYLSISDSTNLAVAKMLAAGLRRQAVV